MNALILEMEKLRAANTGLARATEHAECQCKALREALQTIAHSFWNEGETDSERVADLQQQAHDALAKGA